MVGVLAVRKGRNIRVAAVAAIRIILVVVEAVVVEAVGVTPRGAPFRGSVWAQYS